MQNRSNFIWLLMRQRLSDFMFQKTRMWLIFRYFQELGIHSANSNNSPKKVTRCLERIDFHILFLLGIMGTLLDSKEIVIVSVRIATTRHFWLQKHQAITQLQQKLLELFRWFKMRIFLMLLFDLGSFAMNTMYQILKLIFELEFKSFLESQIFMWLRTRMTSSQWIFNSILTFHQKALKVKKSSSLLKWDKREIS